MSFVFGIAAPLMLHMIVTELVAVVSGGKLDVAARTLCVSLIVLPFAVWMYQKDRAERQKIKEEDQTDGGAGSPDRRMEHVKRSVLCFLGGGILNLLWSGLLSEMKIQQHFSNTTQEALFAGGMAVQILAMGILVPVTEELIFRGLIYRRMRKLLPYGQAVILGALLFAVYHGNVIQMIFAFPMAVIMSVIYEKGGLFCYPVLFHMGCNLTAIVVNYLTV